MKKSFSGNWKIRRMLFFVLLFMICAAILHAEDVLVEFLDGLVEVKEAGKWVELEIGDSIPANGTIRLGEDSVVELSRGEAKIAISAPGTYEIAELLKGRGEQSKLLGSFMKSALSRAVGEPEAKDTVSMGVRAAEVEDDTFEWMDEEVEVVKEGKELLEEGLYREALRHLVEAQEEWGLEEEGELAFFIGVAYAMLGEKGRALSRLTAMEPDPWEEFYADWVFITGQLLMESLAFEKAAHIFEGYLAEYPADESSQLALYLTGLCYGELGDGKASERYLRKAYDASPNSELGRIITKEHGIK